MLYDDWKALPPIEAIEPADLFRPAFLCAELKDQDDKPMLMILSGTIVNATQPVPLFRFLPAQRELFFISVEIIAAPLRFLRWAGPRRPLVPSMIYDND